MDNTPTPDYFYYYLMALPVVFATVYVVGSRLSKWLKARWPGFRSDVFQACLWLLVLVGTYFLVAPEPGSQGELVYFKSSPFSGKSDYWKAVEAEIKRQLELPRLLHVQPFASFGAEAGRDGAAYKQFSALASAGFYERQEWQALDLDGAVESFSLSEKGAEFYDLWREGFNYGNIALKDMVYWHYAGRRDREWRQVLLSRRGAPTSSKNVSEYSESAPRRILFNWEFTRLEEWARQPELLEAFPILKEQLGESAERQHAVLVYGARLHGINPWQDPTLPNRYYLKYPVVNYRQATQPSPKEVFLNKNSILEALDTYLYERVGFVRLTPGSQAAKLVARKEKAAKENGWDKLDARRVYEEKWASLRAKEEERRKGSPYGSLNSMGALSKNLAKLSKTINEEWGFPEKPNSLPPAFEPDAPGQHRFAVLRVDKIVHRGPAYAKDSPDGWLYEELSFTCKLVKQAAWARDKEVLRLLPALGRALAEAEERVFTWTLRYKEPDRAELGLTRYNCEVLFDRAKGSGI